ncbi:MAG: hypothetical protein HGA45_38045, partial [Chloroflexales bacterium]|nr:hypothetical protein [Chloroflexales bacterium]
MSGPGRSGVTASGCRAFSAVVQGYPSSVKVEAATYRISLIGLEYRQRELLKLL